MTQQNANASRRARRSVVSVLACGLIALFSQSGARGQNAVGRGSEAQTVALSPGTCASISTGDTVMLDWSPAFEHPGSVVGMRSFELLFARAEDRERTARLGPSLRLLAFPRMHGEVPGQPGPEIEEAGNGVYHLRFHPDLSHVEPGEYHLVAAQASPKLLDPALGSSPVMTNSPLSYPFCVTVLPSVSPRDRGVRHLRTDGGPAPVAAEGK